MQLRDYQSAAVEACWEFIASKPGNPCIVLPTGAGKSLVLAKLAHDAATLWGGRVVLLAHMKELLEQNASKLKAISPDLDVGIYSAGLGKRQRKAQVLVAGIQSVYNKACEFDPFDLIIVDEAHLLPPDGEGMYRRFLADCETIKPHCRLVGLTATPYRMGSGWLCGAGNLLTDVCYEVGVKELILQGYLSKLISKEPIQTDTSQLHVRGGEFIADESEKLMLDVIEPACKEIVSRTATRRSVLVFCQSVEHAVKVNEILGAAGGLSEIVTGDTPSRVRAHCLREFKAGEIKYLVNVNVLTTGFDAPNVDCVCLLRPTLSAGLYYQMVGRGFRLSPGKENCLVLDFAGNVRRHGPVDQIEPKPREAGGDGGEAPTKTCPECETICHAGFSNCPECGFEFPDRNKAKHESKADSIPVTSLEVIRETYPVSDIKYARHQKRSAEPGDPETLRVDYRVNPLLWISEWVCIEHPGYAGQRARAWWKARSNDPFPTSAARAADVGNDGGLAVTQEITVEHKGGEKFPRVVLAKVGPKPEGVTPGDDDFDFPVPETATVDWVDVLF